MPDQRLPIGRTSSSQEPRPPLPSEASRVFSDQLDWTKAGKPKRSQDGVTTGVYFVEFPVDRVVIKAYSAAQHELLASKVARVAGLRVPEMCHERHNAPYIRRFIQVDEGVPIIAMERIKGENFFSLSERSKDALMPTSHAFQPIMHDIGKITALDYFLGNIDRFPLAGLGGFNRGNVMMSDEHIVTIDSTLCTEKFAKNKGWICSFRSNFEAAVKACRKQEGPSKRDHVFSGLVEFFSNNVSLSWPDMRCSVLAGFRAASSRLAAIEHSSLDQMIQESQVNLPKVEDSVNEFLHANLRALKKAESFGVFRE